jgi:hypothetical protein
MTVPPRESYRVCFGEGLLLELLLQELMVKMHPIRTRNRTDNNDSLYGFIYVDLARINF